MGYLVPDGFSEMPEVVVYFGTQQVLHTRCEEFYEGVKANGRHQTGLVGFRLDENSLPGITHAEDLTIKDASTGLVIHRRLPENSVLQQRVLRLETQILPYKGLDDSLKVFFALHSPNIDRFGEETIHQLFHLQHYRSHYLSGRILISKYERQLDEGLKTIAVLNNPYVEFAIRLFSIGKYKKHKFNFLSARDLILYEPAITYFSGVDMANESDLKNAIKRAPKDVLKLFSSPLTRQLSVKSPDEDVTLDSVSGALNMLSRIDSVSITDFGLPPSVNIGALLGVPSKAVNDVQNLDIFSNIAEFIKSLPTIDSLLESDLVLYHYIKEAIEHAEGLDQGNAKG